MVTILASLDCAAKPPGVLSSISVCGQVRRAKCRATNILFLSMRETDSNAVCQSFMSMLAISAGLATSLVFTVTS